jgi:hypothetical protein
VVCFEIVSTLADICRAKGLSCERCDFLDMVPVAGFDRVIMNPPFENQADIDHVFRAFDWLAPGGRLVAIMSGGTQQRQNKKAEDFRHWVDATGGAWYDLPNDGFADGFRPTGVKTVALVLDAPQPGEVPMPAAEPGRLF